MFNNIIKIVELLIDEEQEAVLESVSLVEDPAIRKNFMYFNDQEPIKFAFEDEEERIVVGPAMVPDLRIPRMDDETGEVYYVYFTKESISKAAELLMKQDKASKQNTDHEDNFTNDVYIMESWIKEGPEDKANKYGFGNLPVGTWFVKMRVLDDEVWEDIKKGELNGFSVQGAFVMGQEEYEQAFARHKRKYKKIRKKYGRLYKGLELEEKKVLDQILYLVEMDENDMFDNPEAAAKRSKELGLRGEIHSHYDEELGMTIYMPGKNMEDYEKAKENMEIDVSSLPDYVDEGATGPVSKEAQFAAENAILKMAGQIGIKYDFANAGAIPGFTTEAQLVEFLSQSTTRGRTLYKYDGPPAERDFCRQMLSFDRYYTYEELKRMEQVAVNAGFGRGGSGTYSIWKFHGGPNCKHAWRKFYVSLDAEDNIKIENKGLAPGLAGTETYDQPNRGYMMSEMSEKFRSLNIVERGIVSRFLADVRRDYGLYRFESDEFVSVRPGESKDEYIGRCMSGLQGEFPNEDQRYAVCITEWEGSADFAAVEDLKVGDAVSWKTADQNPRGRIREIVREGSKKVPGRDFEVSGTPDNPGYIIEIYREDAEGKWQPSDEFVGRKADSILKNVEL